MKNFESVPSKRVQIILGGASEATADIVDELPEVGDKWEGRSILEVMPNPLTWTQQKTPDVWQYAIWYLHLEGDIYRYVAIHEEEAEKI